MTKENNHFITVGLCMQNSRAGPIPIFGGEKYLIYISTYLLRRMSNAMLASLWAAYLQLESRDLSRGLRFIVVFL